MHQYVMNNFELEDYVNSSKKKRKYLDHLHGLYSLALTVGQQEFLKQRNGCDLIENVHVIHKLFNIHTPNITSGLFRAYGYE